jgi:hypothetical protein
VLLVTIGCSPVGILEQMLTGWLVFYLKQSLFVFTNRRIFHIPTKSKYTYRRSIAQILYADCQSLQLRGGTLKAKYWSGKTEKFINLGRPELKRIKALLREMPLEGYQSSAKGRVHLCPDCAGELVEGRFTCPQCGLQFKSKQEARSISIIYPGGGYFYTGHWWLGISDAFVETLLAALLVTSVFDAFRGKPEGMFNVAWFAIVLAIEKAITIYHSNHFVKEYIPKSG